MTLDEQDTGLLRFYIKALSVFAFLYKTMSQTWLDY